MAKPRGRPAPIKAPPLKKGGGKRAADEYELPSDSDDDAERDAFKARKDKVSLRMSDEDEDDDALDVEGVYDLDEDGEDEGDDGEEETDEDDIIEDALRQGGAVAELARQAKALGQKLKLQRAESSDEEDEAEEKGRAAVGGELWGANKRAYYDADTADGAADEEAIAMEEAEALRLQRKRAAKLSAADFGLSDEEEEGEDDEEEEDDDEDEDGEGQQTLGALAKGAAAAPADAKKPSSKQRQQQQQQQKDALQEQQQAATAAADAKRKGKAAAGAAAQAVQVEAVARDLGALGDEARMAALMADAPELLSLLADLQDSLGEVRHRVAPLLSELREGGLATAEGLSYLEAKHLLLLSYCIHIVFYLLLKAEGRPVRDHPVIARLVELRAYLEKVRPIDKQMAYQVDKLLKAAQLATAGAAAAPTANGHGGGDADGEEAAAGPGPGSAALEADALRYGPRPDALVPKAARGTAGGRGDDEDGGKPGVYVPPRLAPTSMEMDAARAAGGRGGAEGDGVMTAQERRRLKEVKAKAARSDTLRALAAELAGAPEEERLGAASGMDESLAALRTRAKLAARAAAEEDLFVRVPLGRDEAKRLRAQRRAGLSGAGLLEDFGDEVADLVETARGGDGPASTSGRGASLNELFAKQKVSQRFGADHPSLSARPRGGDEDLPLREPLHDRRAKFDAAAARRGARAGGSDDGGRDGGEEDDVGGGGRGKKRAGGEEDEFYAQAKAAAASRKKVRAEAHRAPALAPPAPEPLAEGARGITDEIQRNRGLTPHRRRDQKNPRKKNRMKFEKAMVRVKGAVQPVRKPEAVAYGGEATGIKAKVAKSRRL